MSPVYRVEGPADVDEEYARSIAAKFGITGDPTQRTPSGGPNFWEFEDTVGRAAVDSRNCFYVVFQLSRA